MGFLTALKNLLSHEPTTPQDDVEKEREALRQAWGLDADDPVLAPPQPETSQEEPSPIDGTASAYDLHRWQNKVVHLATEAREIAKPDFAAHLAAIMAEYHNLNIPPEAAFETAKTAFTSALRHVVADRQVTVAEHQYLETLKEALGLPNDIAAGLLASVVAEAEAVFKARVTGI
jgi:hypothetical protein